MILEKETYEKFGYYSTELRSHSAKNIVVACDNCGKIRMIKKTQYRSFCVSCSKKGKKNPRWKEKTRQICKWCGKEFYVFPSKIKYGAGKFCSRKCMGKSYSQNRRGEKHPRWAGGLIKKICPICKKEFYTRHSLIKKGKGKYCSSVCARKAQKMPTHHTKPELIFEEICKKYNLPFKYTGDGDFWIGKEPSVNPDFVECNSKKIAIEIFSYWHDPIRRFGKVPYSGTYKGRKKILKKYGWKLIVFWQEDLERKDAERFVLIELKKQGIIL